MMHRYGIVIVLIILLLTSSCAHESINTAKPNITFEPNLASETIGEKESNSPANTSTAIASIDPHATSKLDPPPEYSADTVRISIESGYGPTDINAQNNIHHLERLLQKYGWNMRFELVNPSDYAQDQDASSMLPYALLQASTSSEPDGYLLIAGEGKDFFDNDLTMDLTGLLPQTAPAYYAKYRKLFDGDIESLPMSVTNWRNRSGSLSLFLRSDISDRLQTGVNNIEDVLKILDLDADNQSTQLVIYDFDNIINVWAYEQGYYPLGDYGLPGYLFSRYDDPDCNPVLLEKIPGFASYAADIRKLQGGKRIIQNFQEANMSNCIGFVGNTNNPGLYISYKDYLTGPLMAYPIAAGCPFLPDDTPECTNEMAISVRSSRAKDIIRFVEWANIDRKNHDIIYFGEQGIDYTIDAASGRYESLYQGKAMQTDLWLTAFGTGLFYTGTTRLFFENYEYARYDVNAPVNTEVAAKRFSETLPPIWAIEKLRPTSEFYKITGEMATVCGNIINTRSELMRSIFDSEYINPSGKGISKELDALSVLDNQSLLNACRLKISTLKSGK